MKINKLGLLIFFQLLIGFAASAANPVRSTDQNIDQISERALQILCHMAICVTKPAVTVLENYKDFYGYYHLDENRISVLPDQSDLNKLLTLVHEYTHVYRSQYNEHEETWLSEGLAKFVEYKASKVWPETYQRRLVQKPELVFENSERRFGVNGQGYADSFWLVYYLYQHFGGDQLLLKLLQSKLSGWDNVISAINEIQSVGAIAKNANVLNKYSILRHFAVSLLLNDQFAAKYSLFYLGPDFTPLVTSGFNEVTSDSLTLTSGHKIVLSRKRLISGAREKYIVKSIHPVEIVSANETDSVSGLFYISIF